MDTNNSHTRKKPSSFKHTKSSEIDDSNNIELTQPTPSKTSTTDPLAVQSQIKKFIDEINDLKSKTHFILDSLLQRYNTSVKKYISSADKLEQASILIREANEDMLQASHEISDHALDSINCKNLSNSIQSNSISLHSVGEKQADTLVVFKRNILDNLKGKVESDMMFLKQQMSFFGNQYREHVKEFNASSEKIKRIKKHGKISDMELLKQEMELHETCAGELLEFSKSSYKSASDEECRRYNFFHSKQVQILSEYQKISKKTLEIDVPSASSCVSSTKSVRSHRKSSNSTHKSEKSRSEKSYSTSVGTHRIEHSSIVEPMARAKLNDSDMVSSQETDNLTSVSQIKVEDSFTEHQEIVRPHELDPHKSGYVIPAKQERVLVTARHAHTSNSEKQLCFLVGDLILVLINESKSGWKYGENTRTQERGWYPETYVMDVSEKDSHV